MECESGREPIVLATSRHFVTGCSRGGSRCEAIDVEVDDVRKNDTSEVASNEQKTSKQGSHITRGGMLDA